MNWKRPQPWSISLATKALSEAPKDAILIEIFAVSLEAERERCAAKCEQEATLFLSPEYSFNQPIGTILERFACEECAKAIRSGE